MRPKGRGGSSRSRLPAIAGTLPRPGTPSGARPHSPAFSSTLAGMAAPASPGAPGLLYYDPNPTTARLATAGLRLAGYQIHVAEDADEAAALTRAHGPQGDGAIRAIVLDASVSPDTSAQILKAIIRVPGAADLPGLLLVSRKNPTPIPGAEALPTLRRPFSTPALVKAIRALLDDDAPGLGASPDLLTSPLAARLAERLAAHGIEADRATVEAVAVDLAGQSEVGALPVALQVDLSMTRLESVLALVAETGRRGVVELRRDRAMGRLHLDAGHVLRAEISGVDEDLKLGRFIVESGFLRDEDLQPHVEGSHQLPLGLRLVRAELITESELTEALQTQAREITCHLLTWDEGRLTFSPVEHLDPMAEAARANQAELMLSDALLDGLRRRDETAAMGAHMASTDDVYLRIDENLMRLGPHALTREELAIVELLNGRNAVKDVARKTRSGTFAVARVLYRLSKANLVRRRMPPLAV